MSSIVYLKNKSNGKVYAYLNESVWNSELKKCECKRKCIGHVDPITGEIVSNRGHKEKEYVTVKSIGVSYFLESLSEKIGLLNAVKQAFPDDWKIIMSTVFYIVSGEKYLNKIKNWTLDNDIPYGKSFTDSILADVLPKMDENSLFIFFREWRDKFRDDEFYTLFTSSTSSYENRSETIRFNGLPSLIVNPKTNLALTYNMKTGLPVHFKNNSRNPSNLTGLIKQETVKRWLNFEKMIYVLDREYCTDENMNNLFRGQQKFLIRSSPEFSFARNAIVQTKERIMAMENYMTIMGEPLFVMSFMNYWKGKKCYIHIYFSSKDAEDEFSLFLSLLDECHRELENNIFVPEHSDFYNKYFLVQEKGNNKIVEKNGEAIMSYNDIAGFIVLISNSIKSPTKALEFYMNKDKIEHNFENMLNEKDRINLRLYHDASYDGRLFIQFLALILFSEMRKVKSSNAVLKTMGFYDIIHELSSIRKVTVPGFKTPFYTDLSNKQAEIFRAFGIKPDLK